MVAFLEGGKMSAWTIEDDSFTNQAMENCLTGFNDIVNGLIPKHKSYLDFSIGSLHFYDRLLDENFKGTHDRLVFTKLGFSIIGCYLGEVILRNLGGKWIILSEITSVLRGFEPLIFISTVNQFLINPISEVAWKTMPNSRVNIMDYLLAVKKEMTQAKKKGSDSHLVKKYNHMFHENKLDRIFDYRELEADRLGYYVNYLTIPILEMNKWS